MTKWKNLVFTVFMLCLTALISGCHKSDLVGDWEPMRWQSDLSGDLHKLSVPTSGGTYTLKCTNYTKLRFAGITHDNSTVGIGEDAEIIAYHITTKWSDVALENNILTIEVSPNTTGRVRRLVVRVSAGDAFDQIVVTQSK